MALNFMKSFALVDEQGKVSKVFSVWSISMGEAPNPKPKASDATVTNQQGPYHFEIKDPDAHIQLEEVYDGLWVLHVRHTAKPGNLISRSNGTDLADFTFSISIDNHTPDEINVKIKVPIIPIPC